METIGWGLGERTINRKEKMRERNSEFVFFALFRYCGCAVRTCTAAADSATCFSKQAGLDGHFERRRFGLCPRHVLESSKNLLSEDVGHIIFRKILGHM